MAVPTVDGVLNGYNGTIFCYGQTGSGKSFTMEGGSLYDPVSKGLIPRMFEYLFEKILAADQSIEFNIKCSYLEIYMERICDLLDGKLYRSSIMNSDFFLPLNAKSNFCPLLIFLAAKKQNLQVKEDKTRGLYV